MGPKSNGFGVIGPDAPQFPYIEGQRPHGRRPVDRRVRLVDREFAESDHRQDPVPHARHDGAVAEFGRRPSAIGGAVGNGAAEFGADRGADVPRLRLRRRPRGGSRHRDLDGGSRERDGDGDLDRCHACARRRACHRCRATCTRDRCRSGSCTGDGQRCRACARCRAYACGGCRGCRARRRGRRAAGDGSRAA